MTREWIALYPAILSSDRWLSLDPQERHAWIVTLLLAVGQSPEGRFDSASHLSRLLLREGIQDPPTVVGRLIDAGALETDGVALLVHNWSKHQKTYRGPSDEPEAKRLREQVRYWRGKAGDGPVTVPVEPVTDLREPVIEEKRREEKRGDTPPTPPSQIPDLSNGHVGAVQGGDIDALDVFYEVTGSRPWGKQTGSWIQELQSGYGIPETIAAIRAELPGDRTKILSRVEARLGRDAERKKQDRPKAVPSRNGVDPEVAARQRTELARMIRDGGETG